MEINRLELLKMRELDRVLESYGFAPSLPNFDSEDGDDLEMILYRAIKNGRVRDNFEAMSELFGDGDIKNIDEYQRIKSRLKLKLLNAILFVDVQEPKNSKTSIIFIRLQRKLAIVKILIRLGAAVNAFSEAKRGYSEASKYYHTQLALEFAFVIRNHYCNLGNITQYNKYDEIVSNLQRIYTGELESKKALQQFEIHYQKRISYKKGTETLVEENMNRVKAILETVDSPEIRSNYYFLCAYYHDIHANYTEVYRIAEEALTYFEPLGDVIPKGQYSAFYLQQMGSCIYTRDEERGLRAFKNAEKYSQKGNENWFKLQEFGFIFMAHIGKLEEANRIFEEATTIKSFDNLNEQDHERWNILRLYVSYLNGVLKTSISNELRMTLQSSTELQHDKIGFGFDIRLLHILYLIESKAYGKLTESIDSFKTYCVRHLDLDKYPKSRAFLRLVLLLERHKYNAFVIHIKSRQWVERMVNLPITAKEASENIQVIPYEEIFRRMLASLRKDAAKIQRMIRDGKLKVRESRKKRVAANKG